MIILISPSLVKENHPHAIGGYLVFIGFVVLDNLCMKIPRCYMMEALSPGMGLI